MKKVIEKHYKEKIIPAKSELKEVIVCDICLEREAKGRCTICGRDICNKHIVEEYSFGSDYADKYCSCCHDLYDKYRKYELEIENRYEQETASLSLKWKEESLRKSKC